MRASTTANSALRVHIRRAVRHRLRAHDPSRKRKLLVHRKQIDELIGQTQQQPLTLIPLSLYFKDGKAKVQLALARGRKLHDKRHAIAERDAARTWRALPETASGGPNRRPGRMH